VLELADDLQVEVFRLLDQPRTAATLAARTAAGADTIAALLARWSALGIVFGDGGGYLHVAVESDNQILARLDHWRRGGTTITEHSREVSHAGVAG
jgi:hypothetical protein